MVAIPVMRPLLPALDRIAPYIEKVDATRLYTNHGPLASALEDRLAAHLRLPPKTIAMTANATLGLTLSLMAQAAPRGTLCVIPAWNFIAGAHAAMLAGLTPYFVDVDAGSKMLGPDRIDDEIARAPAPVGAVMPVAPFGRPIDVAAWDRWRARTGIAVVIDAAACFDRLVPGATPAVVSLHATKVIGVGEGGFVASTDTALIKAIRTRTNFGFFGSREAVAPAANAKFSEYHAAVGLAALDEWQSVRAQWVHVAEAYRAAFAESNAVRFDDGFGRDWIASTCILSLADGGASRVAQALAAADIETRRWWGDGSHAHPATAGCPRTELPVTSALASATIGLPFFRDLAAPDVRRIVDVVLSVGAG